MLKNKEKKKLEGEKRKEKILTDNSEIYFVGHDEVNCVGNLKKLALPRFPFEV